MRPSRRTGFVGNYQTLAGNLTMWKKIAVLLEMIKFQHTIFAMPFALMGAFLAKRGIPDFSVFFWVVIAMVGARTSAMTFNRIADRRFDAANPRTTGRALAVGEVTLIQSWVLMILASFLFFFACFMLNPLALRIAPLALGLTLFYSLTKRFTWLCHVVLGVALAISPLGGWVAASATLQGYPWVLSLAVLFWVAGFDCIYACLDADFDREAGLYSIPSIFGRKKGFRIAVLFHALAFLLFTLTGVFVRLNNWYFLGLAITAAALFYQHLIVSPQDLSRIRQSFFSMNGIIALTLFGATCLALATEG
ncbi:MAG: UbiA-like polyprenyltransferase [Desulfobulbus sp.]